MTIRHTYPAFDVLEATEGQPVALSAGDRVAVAYESKNHGLLWHLCKINSVVSYSIKCGECPIRALEQARKTGEPLWWMLRLPTTVDGLGRPKVTYTGLREGQVILFEGRRFILSGTDIVMIDTEEKPA